MSRTAVSLHGHRSNIPVLIGRSFVSMPAFRLYSIRHKPAFYDLAICPIWNSVNILTKCGSLVVYSVTRLQHRLTLCSRQGGRCPSSA
jgi:hypothetical protein